MTAWLILLTIGLAWLGAVIVWLAGDKRPRVQHILAVLFSVGAALAALALIPNTTDQAVISLDAGSVFGLFTFVAGQPGVFLAVIATGYRQPDGHFLRGIHGRRGATRALLRPGAALHRRDGGLVLSGQPAFPVPLLGR
jgi:hypothetical protein